MNLLERWECEEHGGNLPVRVFTAQDTPQCPICERAMVEVGYVPLTDYRGAVDRIAALERERDELAQRLRQASLNAEAAEAEVERLTGGQYEQPATKDTTAVDALKRIRDHANSADDPAMIAQQALDQLEER